MPFDSESSHATNMKVNSSIARAVNTNNELGKYGKRLEAEMLCIQDLLDIIVYTP